MSMHTRCEELLRQAEKLLRDADEDIGLAPAGHFAARRRRRNAINAACNALHRAVKA